LTAILIAITWLGSAILPGFTSTSRVKPMVFMARAAAPTFSG
jgi:hypothetical protein